VKTKFTALVFGLALFVSAGGVFAEDTDGSDNMEATMRLMGKAEAELPDAITNEITLPDAVLDKDPESPAVDASKSGLDKANEHWPFADDAINNAAGMAEQAQENRETRGRSEDRPEPPDVPDPPGQPGG
jgi:hypothetical protein